jgi:transcription factor C subunit 6
VDIVSGYPSDPFIVSTVPIGGVLAVTDLRRPSAETTYHPNMMVSLQPNLLAWTPHLRGYAAMWPSAFAGNPNLTFLPARGFPLCRHLLTVNGQPTCVNIGVCHPYILTGTTDGTLWVFNILRKLSSHREKTLKVKLFHHEYHAPLSSTATSAGDEETKSRGVCRILHGFLPEPNTHPTGVKMAETQRQNRQNNLKENNKGKGKAKVKTVKPQSKTTGQPEGEVDEEAAMTTGPGPIVLYEPYTRITAAIWNPNVEFSWWAAAAMGSGLVRVMDVGADPQGQEQDDDDDEYIPGRTDGGYNMDAMGEEDDDVEGEEDEDVEMASWEE